jgi:hypothetical protein
VLKNFQDCKQATVEELFDGKNTLSFEILHRISYPITVLNVKTLELVEIIIE